MLRNLSVAAFLCLAACGGSKSEPKGPGSTENTTSTIAAETSDGMTVRLEDGGARLILNGETSADSGIGEYPDIYRTFVDLIDELRRLVDVAPLRLVADCLLVGGRTVVESLNR